MAENRKSSSAQRGLECSICLCNYNKTCRSPKVLTCGHSFCKSCISSLADKTIINCPKCREKCYESGIKTNYTVIEVLEHLCDECCVEEHDVLCRHCDQNLCSSCIASHSVVVSEELSSGIKSLEEEIDRAVDLSSDSSRIRSERNKAANELKNMRNRFQRLHELLDKKEKEMEERIINLRDKNIQGVAAWMQDLKTQINSGKCILSEAESDSIVKSSLKDKITPDNIVEMMDLTRNCSMISCGLQQQRETTPGVVFYKYVDPDVQCVYDIGHIAITTDSQETRNLIAPEDYKKFGGKAATDNRHNGNEGLNKPWAVTISHNGHVIVSDSGSSCIKIYSKDSHLRTVSPCQDIHEHPTGNIISSRSKLFVNDFLKNEMIAYSMIGLWFTPLAESEAGQSGSKEPLGAKFGPDGMLIYVQ